MISFNNRFIIIIYRYLSRLFKVARYFHAIYVELWFCIQLYNLLWTITKYVKFMTHEFLFEMAAPI